MRRPALTLARIRELARKIDDAASAQGRAQAELSGVRTELSEMQAAHAAELRELRASVASLPGPEELDAAILKGTLDATRRIRAAVEKEIKHTFRQLEALHNLNAMLPTTEVLPASRGWAASPDLLLVLIDQVITGRPSLIVECGSGASTLWLALAIRRFGIDARVVALDHDPVFAGKTRDFLVRHGVGDLAEVRDAPLENFTLGGEIYAWYTRAAWEDLTGIDLLFVDGPPEATGHQARYPALPLLNEALSPAAVVVLDDLVVPDMQKVLRLWLDTYPDFGSETLALEKQAAVLRRGSLKALP
jgi:predicted O-methyltransferase YrrM